MSVSAVSESVCLCLFLCLCLCLCLCNDETMRSRYIYKFSSKILLDDSSKTVFVSVYSGLPSFDTLPPVGCFCARLECVQPSRLKLGSKNTTGMFLG